MVCLDTSFLIDVIRGSQIPDKFRPILSGEYFATIATPSIVELTKGLYLKKNARHIADEEKEKIEQILSSLIVLTLDKESAIMAGKIEAKLENEGEIIDIEDIMIGAIAKRNNETLITRNKKHFEKIPGLKIESY